MHIQLGVSDLTLSVSESDCALEDAEFDSAPKGDSTWVELTRFSIDSGSEKMEDIAEKFKQEIIAIVQRTLEERQAKLTENLQQVNNDLALTEELQEKLNLL